MNVAIYYHPEAYSISGPRLMGRNAAGESFLRGFIAHSNSTSFWAQVQNTEHGKHFAKFVAAMKRDDPVHIVRNFNLGDLAKPGIVYHPGPGLAEHSFQRAIFGNSAWSLCGITHTTSSAGAMDALSDLITAPVQPWDAVICTSSAVKKNVEGLLQAKVNYLKERLGVTKLLLPQLPVIPLGIHTSDFVFTEIQKTKARADLGISKDAIVVLFMGRLSFHAKAHPLAMYQALETASRTTGKSVFLIECGWHANENIQNAYEEAAKLACPNVKVITLDGRRSENRNIAWAAADVFCSLSDNIQETFGIAPIEAMAAGLPVVVSDWDGYKDTVRDGVDGFRIPTVMPHEGLGGDIALRHALNIDTYDMYCGHTSSLIAVDVHAAVNAFEKLFNSEILRKEMGQAGRKRAQSLYDWKFIISQYEALWAHLNEIRAASPNALQLPTYRWPARLDPFHAFSGYATSKLTLKTKLKLEDADVETALKRTSQYMDLAMVKYAQFILPTKAEISLVLSSFKLQIISQDMKATLAEDLLQNIPHERKPFIFRSLTWLLKLGILKVVE